MMAPDHADCRWIRESIETQGMDQPIVINEFDQIMDGRHRVREAIALGLEKIPVTIKPNSEAAAIIFNTVSARRHLMKWQTAYSLGPVIDQYFGSGKGRRLANLMPASKQKMVKNPNVLSKRHVAENGEKKVSLNPFQQFLSNIGISKETWERANRVRAILLEKPDLRERFEPLMFTDDPAKAMSLEAVAKAVGCLTGVYAEGNASPGEDRKEHNRLLCEYFQKVTIQFKFWKKMEQSHRKQVAKAFVTESRVWPAEVRLAMFEELQHHPPCAEVNESEG